MNDMDELSVQYIKLRQKREVLSQQFKDADAVIEKDMAEIETQLLDMRDELHPPDSPDYPPRMETAEP